MEMEQKKQIEKDFFDQIALDGEEYQRFAEESYGKIFSLFESLAEPKPGETILDMGCGTGAFTTRLKQEFPQNNVLGIDISEQCIAKAQAMYKDITFTAGDVEKTGYADKPCTKTLRSRRAMSKKPATPTIPSISFASLAFSIISPISRKPFRKRGASLNPAAVSSLSIRTISTPFSGCSARTSLRFIAPKASQARNGC
jgi:SAM-dependent methyltransferase